MKSLFRAPLLAALLVMPGAALAQDSKTKAAPRIETAALPAAAEVQSLSVHPTTLKLLGSDDAAQLILTAHLKGGRVFDLTGDVKYEVADTMVAKITASGRVIPLGNGTTTIT